MQSPSFNVARVRRALPVRTAQARATYDWHAGNDLTLYHDGSTDAAGSAGAFHDIDVALGQAEQFIFIADWSFQPYMRLRHDWPATPASTVGMKLINQARSHPNMVTAIHNWDHTNRAADDPQNDDGGYHLNGLAGGTRPSNILWRASSRTGENGGAGFGWSHHQKFVVLDVPGPGGRR